MRRNRRSQIAEETEEKKLMRRSSGEETGEETGEEMKKQTQEAGQ
jgi:hypothetical protein